MDPMVEEVAATQEVVLEVASCSPNSLSYCLTIISWLSLFYTIREAALDTRLIPSVAGLDQAVL